MPTHQTNAPKSQTGKICGSLQDQLLSVSTLQASCPKIIDCDFGVGLPPRYSKDDPEAAIKPTSIRSLVIYLNKTSEAA